MTDAASAPRRPGSPRSRRGRGRGVAPTTARRGPSRGSAIRLALLRGLSVAALVASAALLADVVRPGRGFCPLEEACAKARGSALGSVFGIPTAGVGLLAFASFLVLTLIPAPRARGLVRPAAFLAGASGLGLLAYQGFFLGSFCPFCVVADAAAVAAGVVVLGWQPRLRRVDEVLERASARTAWSLVALAAVATPMVWPRPSDPAWVAVPETAWIPEDEAALAEESSWVVEDEAALPAEAAGLAQASLPDVGGESPPLAAAPVPEAEVASPVPEAEVASVAPPAPSEPVAEAGRFPAEVVLPTASPEAEVVSAISEFVIPPVAPAIDGAPEPLAPVSTMRLAEWFAAIAAALAPAPLPVAESLPTPETPLPAVASTTLPDSSGIAAKPARVDVPEWAPCFEPVRPPAPAAAVADAASAADAPSAPDFPEPKRVPVANSAAVAAEAAAAPSPLVPPARVGTTAPAPRRVRAAAPTPASVAGPAPARVPPSGPRAKPAPSVVLVEYLNPFCPHCRATHERLQSFLGTTSVPVRLHRVYVWSSTSTPLWAKACACAAASGREEALFAELLRANRDAPEAIWQAAQRAGLDVRALCAAVERGDGAARLEREWERVMASRIRALPTLDVGRRRLEGEQSLADLRSAVDAAAATLPAR